MKKTKMQSLYDFATSRPKISPANHGGLGTYYRAAVKDAKKQRTIFLTLYRTVNQLYSIDEIEQLLSQYEHKGSEQMYFNGERWQYITGLYYPLEYRAAAARILWQILQNYVDDTHNGEEKQLIRIAGKEVVNYFK